MTATRDAHLVGHGALSEFPILSACVYFPSRLSFRRFTIDLSPCRRPTGAQQSLRSPASRPMGAWGASASASEEACAGYVQSPAYYISFLQLSADGCHASRWLWGRRLLRRSSFVSVAASQPAAQPATASNRPQDLAPSELNLGNHPSLDNNFPSFLLNVVGEQPWTMRPSPVPSRLFDI